MFCRPHRLGPAGPGGTRPGGRETKVAKAKVDNSDIDAALFYQLLIGEIELRQGSAGTAYEVILDAARKQRDESLFKRAADIALQAVPATRPWLPPAPGGPPCPARSKRTAT